MFGRFIEVLKILTLFRGIENITFGLFFLILYKYYFLIKINMYGEMEQYFIVAFKILFFDLI